MFAPALQLHRRAPQTHPEVRLQRTFPFLHVGDLEGVRAIVLPGRRGPGNLSVNLSKTSLTTRPTALSPGICSKAHTGRRMPPMDSLFSRSLFAFLVSCTLRLPNEPWPPVQCASSMWLRSSMVGGSMVRLQEGLPFFRKAATTSLA